MIEVNRSLYMDEATGERLAGFGRLQSKLRKIYTELVQSAVAKNIQFNPLN